MSAESSPSKDVQVVSLYTDFATGRISRRDFMSRAATLGVAGAAAAAFGSLASGSADAAGLAQAATTASKKIPLDVAEWSYMWVNVKRAETARGAYVGGQQMYVEYMIPSQVRHPFPVVLVHGGGGQGTDWMETPDGRPGWFQYLVQEGYKVYVVDRPGHGRSPLHPDLHGGFPATHITLESLAGRFTPPAANPAQRAERVSEEPQPVAGCRQRRLAGSRSARGRPGRQLRPDAAASRRGARSRAAGRRGAGTARVVRAAEAARRPVRRKPRTPQPAGPLNVQHLAWRQAGADLLDKIGPAIIMTHSAGGPFGLLVAEARPALVKATVIIEGAGSGFAGGNRWGMSSVPVTYDPPVSDPAEIKTTYVANPEPGVAGYFLQAEPARKLPNLKNTKVVFVTADSSFASPGNPGGVAFLKQAGVQAEEIRLGALGIKGNGHMMMAETNNREVLQPLMDWMNKNVTGSNNQAPAPRRQAGDSLALKLADFSSFWVGTERKTMPYGTIDVGADVRAEDRAGAAALPAAGAARARRRRPDGALHGAGRHVGLGAPLRAGRLHGVSRRSSRARPLGVSPRRARRDRPARHLRPADARHGDVGAGRRTSSGRAPPATWAIRWSISSWRPPTPRRATRSWRRTCGGATAPQLVDRIGPCVILTHSAGGPFGWLVANERPNLVKAVASFEGATAPLVGRAGRQARRCPA